jgi:four helix bundle protein
MQPFRQLIVWQKAHQFRVDCHHATFRSGVRAAPGFRSQFLRAADAIASNVAEGAGQRTAAQFAKYLEVAMSSAHEVDSHLELAKALHLFDERVVAHLLEGIWEVKRILTGFHRAVRKRAAEEQRRDPPDKAD